MLLLSRQGLEARQITRMLLELDHFNADYVRWNYLKRLMLIKIPPTHGFFDESGKFLDRDVVCIGGYLSDERSWQGFLNEWIYTFTNLQFPEGLHMSTFYEDCKKRGLDNTGAAGILEQFIDVIRKHVLLGFIVAMDTQHYKKKLKASRGMIADPAVACLQRLLRLLRDRLHGEGYDGRIIFHLDEDEQYAMTFYKTISKLRKKDEVLGKLIGAVAYSDDTYALPLQSADVLANLTYGWLKECIAGKASFDKLPPLLERLVSSPVPGYAIEHVSEFWNAELIDKHWSEFQVSVPIK